MTKQEILEKRGDLIGKETARFIDECEYATKLLRSAVDFDETTEAGDSFRSWETRDVDFDKVNDVFELLQNRLDIAKQLFKLYQER